MAPKLTIHMEMYIHFFQHFHFANYQSRPVMYVHIKDAIKDKVLPFFLCL